MIIKIPNNNIPERKYIIDVLFSEFFGIDCEIETYDGKNYIIKFHDKEIEIKDAFFDNFREELSYLKKENIPEKVIFSENQFIPEANIPIIYGNSDIEVAENKIFCGIDIFASSFFMLTRWEEYVISEKDKHGRTPDELQLSIRNNFHERPLVNEYLEMLRNMFRFLGIEIENKHQYKAKITHDVDFFARYDKFTKLIKAFVGDIFKRKKLKRAVNTVKTYFQIKKGKSNDPYDTFDYLMNLSEKIGLKSRFYFIPTVNGEEDAQYNINNEAVVKTMQKIKSRGHIVGIHGAYRSYNSEDLFHKELKRFPEGIKITEGRQHYLRFDNPETWQIQQNAGLKFDGTMSFINHIGFRAGTCYEYALFNILTRKKLVLKERPLIFMEQAARKKYPDKELFFSKFAILRNRVKKYEGNFVILWHNNNFNIDEWEDYKEIYEHIIRTL